ncbi:MAG: DUF2236 domain-containing protein, partial [Gammaproteobacteria bacterium]|nr:DUF2236 domain-containing protein [Gammaproteobacteria bacterium]
LLSAMAYSAANGARVLHETGYLENRVARRLVETTQMVIDVMKPGGLAPGGDGVRTAHEIRLLHAAIRYLINHRDSDWDPAWGHPINQEDMAGTLMTFSYVILDGLSKIGINIDRPAQEAYLAAWRAVGQVMGVKEELLPANMELAQELTWFIFDRQGRGSPQGIDLTRALLDTMQSLAPFFMKPFCSSLLRVYVEKDVADYLKVPRHLLRDSLTLGLQRAYGAIDNLLHLSPFGLWGYRLLSHFVIDILTHLGRGDHKQAAFTIPEELHAHWKRWTPG